MPLKLGLESLKRIKALSELIKRVPNKLLSVTSYVNIRQGLKYLLMILERVRSSRFSFSSDLEVCGACYFAKDVNYMSVFCNLSIRVCF